MKIESQDQRIDQLLKGNTFFIPRFQRAYSWEAEHIQQFWADITANFGESYFIGSMVVYEKDKSVMAVVDGQQRLTTITILLCAIRDHFNEIEKNELGSGLQGYIEQRDRQNSVVYVLQTETSYPYLQEEILKNGPADVPLSPGREEEAIERAYKIFFNNINEHLESIASNKEKNKSQILDSKVKWLSLLRDTIFDLKVIVVKLDNEDDAYLIFETLNTRGKDLALADLIRNHFTKFIKPEGQVDQSKLKWNQVLDTISEAGINLDEDSFIVHSWQSRYDFVTKAKTFLKVKERIKKSNAKEHLDLFLEDASYWRSIFDSKFGWSADERDAARSLAALRLFKVVQPTPGVLSLIRSYRRGTIRYRALRDALSMIEKFHFSFNAITSSRSSGGISGMYSSFGRQVFDASDSNSVGAAINELKLKLRDREPPEAEFDAGFEQIIYTREHASQRALINYILRKISKHEKQPTVGETDDLTVEHIVPQSLIGQKFGYNIIGQIGNLILVDQKTNTDLDSKDFITKKRILEENGYKLPSIILDAKSMDHETIKLNTKRISELARNEVWKV